MADSQNVAIFWNYENCHPGSNVTGYEVANAVRNIAHKYGILKQFKAYLEVADQVSSKTSILRSELQTSGVSLTDCPRKDVADKMLLVDMLSYALDNQAPATAILISGDRNFAYAVSVLRHRRYRVILIAPATVHSSLKSQASSVLDWNVDVLDKCVPGILDFGSGSFPPSSHALSDKKNAQSAHFPPPNLPQPGPKMPHQRPAIALVTSTRRRGVSLSQCLEGGLSPIELKGPKAPWVRAGSGSSDLPGPTRTSAGDASQLTDRSTKMDVLPQTLPFFKTGYHTEFVDRSKPQWPSGEMSNHGFAHEFATTGPISESSNKSRAEATAKASMYRQDTFTGKNPCPTMSTPGDPVEKRTTRKRSTFSSFSSTSSLQFGMNSAERSDRIATCPLPAQEGSLAKTSSLMIPEYPALSAEALVSSPQTSSTSLVHILSNDNQLPLNTPLPPSPLSGSGSSIEAKEGDTDAIPAHHFLPLVEQLARLRLAGNLRPLRSIVGQGLVTYKPSVYKDVGVSGFGQYVAQAQQAGIVELGGIGGKAWILLKAEVK